MEILDENWNDKKKELKKSIDLKKHPKFKVLDVLKDWVYLSEDDLDNIIESSPIVEFDKDWLTTVLEIILVNRKLEKSYRIKALYILLKLDLIEEIEFLDIAMDLLNTIWLREIETPDFIIASLVAIFEKVEVWTSVWYKCQTRLVNMLADELYFLAELDLCTYGRYELFIEHIYNLFEWVKNGSLLLSKVWTTIVNKRKALFSLLNLFHSKILQIDRDLCEIIKQHIRVFWSKSVDFKFASLINLINKNYSKVSSEEENILRMMWNIFDAQSDKISDIENLWSLDIMELCLLREFFTFSAESRAPKSRYYTENFWELKQALDKYVLDYKEERVLTDIELMPLNRAYKWFIDKYYNYLYISDNILDLGIWWNRADPDEKLLWQ